MTIVSSMPTRRAWRSCLLEDLASGVGILLAVDGNGLLPQPLLLKEVLVGSVLGVELLEGVALVVGSDIEDGLELLATDDESTLDDRVVALAIDGGAAEEILAGSLQTGVEATDEVVGHESQGKLIVVLVVNAPDGVLLEGNVSPEVLEGLIGLVVGELALPLIERVGSTRQKVDGVLGLRSGGVLLSSRSGGLGGGLRGSLLGGSLRGGVGQSRLLEVVELLSNSGVDGLVDNGFVPTSDVGVLLAPLLVEEVLEAAVQESSAEQIGKSDAFANEEGVVQEMLLDSSDGLGGTLGAVLNNLLVVGLTANKRAEPVAEGVEDLGVEVRHPLQDGGVAKLVSVHLSSVEFRVAQYILLLGLAEESGLLVLGGDCSRELALQVR